ncbi:hypothetical protein FOA52_002129 [Chlamydomonas sp. UWO 241]|nr:hypothetical protein FOA52_002129 [Chlamydomonas sp. UWO 241]
MQQQQEFNADAPAAAPQDGEVEEQEDTGGYVDSASITAAYGRWHKPSEKIAVDKYHKHHTHHVVYEPKHTRIKDLRVFGEGHLLYFYFMKFLAIAFGVLSVIPAIPFVIVYAIGSWYPSGHTDIQVMMLGNYGLISTNNGSSALPYLIESNEAVLNATLGVFSIEAFDAAKSAGLEIVIGALFRSDGDEPPTTLPGGGNKSHTIIATSVFNLIAILAFFSFCVFFILWTHRAARKTLESSVTLKNYSVRVGNVPSDVGEEQLQEYFSRYGDVARVDLAYTCYDLIDMVNERHKKNAKCEHALALLQRSAEALPKVEESLETALLSHQYDLSLINRAIQVQQDVYRSKSSGKRYDVVAAFIVFKEELAKEMCLKAQPRRMFGRPQPDQLFLGDIALHIEQAPEPSDLKYENLEFPKSQRFGYWLASWTFKALILIGGFILVGLSPAIKHNLGAWASGTPVEQCNEYCSYDGSAGVPTLDADTREIYASCHATGVMPGTGLACETTSICYECYCRMVIMGMMLSEVSYCSEFKGLVALQLGSQALAVITIVVVNISLPHLIRALSRFEKHQVRTTEARSATRAIMTMYFLNTNSLLIANAYFPNLRAVLKDTWAGPFIFLGIYNDLTPNWYIDVGRPVAFSQFIGVFTRAALVGIKVWWARHKRAGSWKALTQRELNLAYMGPQFVLEQRYGEHLGVIFITMLFASAIPMLYWSAAASFATMFFIDKYFLLKVCRNPIHYSPHLGIYAAEALPFAVPWHLLFAFWAFSFIAVPRSFLVVDVVYGWINSVVDGLSALWENTNALTNLQMVDRIAQADAFHFLLFFFLSILAILTIFLLEPCLNLMAPMIRKTKRLVRRLRGTAQVAPAPTRRRRAPKAEVVGEDGRMDGDFPDDGDDGNSSDASAEQYGNQGTSGMRREEEGEDGTEATKPVVDEDDEDPANAVRLIGVPEFDIAVRSKLLTGPDSYDMTTLPMYEEAFEDIAAPDEAAIAAARVKLESKNAPAGLEGRLRRRAARLGVAAQPDGEEGAEEVAAARAAADSGRRARAERRARREQEEADALAEMRAGGPGATTRDPAGNGVGSRATRGRAVLEATSSHGSGGVGSWGAVRAPRSPVAWSETSSGAANANTARRRVSGPGVAGAAAARDRDAPPPDALTPDVYGAL